MANGRLWQMMNLGFPKWKLNPNETDRKSIGFSDLQKLLESDNILFEFRHIATARHLLPFENITK